MNSLLVPAVYLQGVTGEPSQKARMDFPITYVGNTCRGGLLTEGIFIPFVTRRTISTKGGPGSELFILGTDPSPLSQND
jgi:hypothetical protein